MTSKVNGIAQYYQSELAYLRKSGMEFAHMYPKIAGKLDLSESESSDPQVERLIESFAFMAGRLQKQIDAQFPEVANALLNLLYEPLALPTPSIVMLHFEADMRLAVKAPGALVPKGTSVYMKSEGNTPVTCSFKTCHDISIWPISLLSVDLVSKDDSGLKSDIINSPFYLKLRFKWFDEKDEPNKPDKLRLYINGDQNFKGELYAAMFIENKPTIIEDSNGVMVHAPVNGIGISEEESILPYNRSIFTGFRLIQEYFAFPDKFYGFDIPIPADIDFSEEFTVFIPLKKYVHIPKASNVLVMNAVPAVNLFEKTTDPLRLTYQDISYTLVADAYRNSSTEIWTIQRVIGVDKGTNDEQEAHYFFSSFHKSSDSVISWYTKRKKSCISGDDIQIFFVDPNFNPIYPADKIFYAKALCTNRHLAEQIPAFSVCNVEITLPVKKIYCLHRPTPQIPAPLEGESIWTLISMLSSTFLDDFNLKLKEILRLFALRYDNQTRNEIDSIVNIKTTKIAKLYKNEAWRGFIRGTNVKIEFNNDTAHAGIMLSYILSNFFSVYTAINTFTELTTVTQNLGRKTWPMQTGLHNYL